MYEIYEFYVLRFSPEYVSLATFGRNILRPIFRRAFITIDLHVVVKPGVIVFYFWESHLVSHRILLAIKSVAFCYLTAFGECSFTTTIGLFY